MKTCDYCTHVEMCGWRKEVKEQGCEFFDDGPVWIPVSEKPKDEERTYLVQLDGGGMCSCRWTNANPFWTELTTDWHWNIFDIPQYCKVVAWMDLEPYREDGEA